MDTGYSLYYLAAAFVLLMTVIEAAYILKICGVIYKNTPSTIPTIKKSEMLTISIYGCSVLIATVLVVPIGAGLSQAAQQTVDVDSYVERILPAQPIQGEPI